MTKNDRDTCMIVRLGRSIRSGYINEYDSYSLVGPGKSEENWLLLGWFKKEEKVNR